METTIMGLRDYWGYGDLWGRMEKKMESTIMGLRV